MIDARQGQCKGPLTGGIRLVSGAWSGSLMNRNILPAKVLRVITRGKSICCETTLLKMHNLQV